MNQPNADTSRDDIEFVSMGTTIRGWHYPCGHNNKSVCVIMAHGFAGTKYNGLNAFASAFQMHGYASIVFDYRFFGESDGEPREQLSIKSQLQDWLQAIQFAKAQGYKKIVLWGSSFAGGHVLQTAASNKQIEAVISQVPHVSGVATALALPFLRLLHVSAYGVLDAIGTLFGKRKYLKAFGKPSELAAMVTPGAYDSMLATYNNNRESAPTEGWEAVFAKHNRFSASVLLALPFYSPLRRAHQITCPVLLQAAKHDKTTPVAPVRKLVSRLANVTYREYEADHFDVYLGPTFEQVVKDQVMFLQTHFGV